MTVTLYGLATCDTCRKARKALPDAEFRDVRANPLDGTEIATLLASFGDKLVNRASTTWRGLSDEARAQPPGTLLAQYPALMKRPVIRTPDALYLGWTPDTRQQLGVDGTL